MDELNLYDDLDEFHEQQERKSKELQEVEEKYQESLKTIEELRKENKTLKKNIRCIELGFQSLLDTARAEIRRKDKEIERLRKEKDDICFRRKTRVKSFNTGENPHSIHNSAVDSNPFRSNIIKENETTLKETTIMPKTSSGKDERPELHKRYRERDNEQSSSSDSKRYRSARDEKDEKYQHTTHEHGKHYQQIKDKDKGGTTHYRESIKETSYKNVDNRNQNRERDEYDKYISQNIHEKPLKSSKSPESYCRRYDRSRSRERGKFNNIHKHLERNRSREDKSKEKFSKTSSKSPPRRSKYHKDFKQDRYKSDDNYKRTTTEKSLSSCDSDLTREKSKYLIDNNSQKDKTKNNRNEKQNSEIGTVTSHNEHVKEEEGHFVLKNKQEKKSFKDLTNDIQLEMVTINSNKSSVPEANTLSTPRKVALFNAIFGNSPCEGSTTATSSNSIVNNIKGILAKSTEIEVISSATTSPGDYTDLNTSSSKSTPVTKAINVLKSDSDTMDSTVTKNNYEKSVKQFQSTRGEKHEIDECFIPIQNEQRAENNVCIDLTKVVDDEIANELEFLQIPGLDLCPLWKQTTTNVNKNTLIEIEENKNSKGETETTINKEASEKNEETIVKALKTKNTKIVENVDIEDPKAVDNIFHIKEYSEKMNVDNIIDSNKSETECKKQNTENSIVTENLVEFSQKQNNILEISNIIPNEKIFSKEDFKRTLNIQDISENLTNDIVIIETFKCGGTVPLKNPYNSYNTPPKNKQQLENKEEEIFNVNETKKLQNSVRNDKMQKYEINFKPETAVKSRENEKYENNVQKESINSLTSVDDTTLLDKSFDCATTKELSAEAATSYFSEKLPIVPSTLKSIKSKFNDVEKSFAGKLNTKDNLLAQGALKDVPNKAENLSSFVETSCDLLQKVCSSNSNVNTADSNKSNVERPLNAVEVVECEKLSDTAQETCSKSSKSDYSLKLSEKDENDVITNPGLPDNLNNKVEKLKERKMLVNEIESSCDVFIKHDPQPGQTKKQNLYQTQNPKSASNDLNSSLCVERKDSTHLSVAEKIDKDKENHTFTTVQASSFNLLEKSASIKNQAAVLDIVDLETSDNLIKNKENYKKGHFNINKATMEIKPSNGESLNSPAVDVNETEAKVVRTSDSEQLDHLINNEKDLKLSKPPIEESSKETNSDKVLILENIQISKPIFTDDSITKDDIKSDKTKEENLLSYAKPNSTSSFEEISSHTVDSKDLSRLGTAEIPQSKEHTNSLMSEVDKIDKAVEVLANEFDINKEEVCEKETFEELISLNKEKPNEIVKSFEIFSQTKMLQIDGENTALTTTQATTSTSSEKLSNALELNENDSNILTIAKPVNFKESQTKVTEDSSIKDDEAVEVIGREKNFVRNATNNELPDNGNSHEEKLESKLPVKVGSKETKSFIDESLTSPKADPAVKASEKEENNVRITANGLPDNWNNHEENLKESKSYIEEVSMEAKSIAEETLTFSKDDEFIKVSGKETNNVRNTATRLPDTWNSHEEKLESKSPVKGVSIKPKSIIVEENLTSLKDNETVFTNNQEKVKERTSSVEKYSVKTISIMEEDLSASKIYQSVEISGEEANNKETTDVDCQTRVENASFETNLMFEERLSSPIEGKHVEASEQEANNVKITVAALQGNGEKLKVNKSHIEEALVETESIVEESLSSSKEEEEVVKLHDKETNHVRMTAAGFSDNWHNHEEKSKESKSHVKEASQETESIVEESITPDNAKVVEVSGKEVNNVTITAGELTDNVKNNKENLESKSPVKEASLETKSLSEKSLTSTKDDQAVQGSKKEQYSMGITAATLPHNVDNNEENFKVETKTIVEESLTSSKDTLNVEVNEKETNIVKNTAVELTDKNKPRVEEGSVETTFTVEQSLSSLQDGQTVEVCGKEENSVKIIDVDCQSTAENSLVETKSVDAESLNKIQSAENFELFIPVSTRDSFSKDDPKPALTKEQKLFSPSKQFNKEEYCEIKLREEEVSNKEKLHKDSNLVRIAGQEISSNLITYKEKAEESQLHLNKASMEITSTIEERKAMHAVEESEEDVTVARFTDQKEEDLKESNAHVKEPSIETKTVDAENLNKIKITKSIKVPKQVPSDNLVNKDVLQPSQTIEKTVISKATSSLEILDTTCSILHLKESKTNNSGRKPNRDETKEIITDSTAKEKTNFNCSEKSTPKIISADISNNKIETIESSHSSSHNTDLFEKHSLSNTLTKDNNTKTPILAPCEAVTLQAHIDDSSAKMLRTNSKEITASYKNDDTKTEETFLNEASKRKTLLLDSNCAQTTSHDDKNCKTESHIAQTSQKALNDNSKNINLEQNSLGSAKLQASNCVTFTNIYGTSSEKEISGSKTETSVAGATTVANLDSIEKPSSKKVNEQLASTINEVIETDTHIAKSLHEVSTEQGSANNAKTSLNSSNLQTASKSINEVDNAVSIKYTTHDDKRNQTVGIENSLEKNINSKKSNSLKDSHLNIEGESKLSHDHTPVALENVFKTINHKNSIEVKTISNDQLANCISTLKVAAETNELTEKPSNLNKTQLCNKTYNPAEAIKICGDQLEVVLKPIKTLSSQTTKLTEKIYENSSLTASENEKQPQIKKSAIKSSQKLTEQNQHNVQQKQISDFEGLIESSVIFKNKDENKYVVINEQTDKDEPNKSITILDKSVEVVKKFKSFESHSANMFENVIDGQYNSVRISNQVGKDFTAPKISFEHLAPTFKEPSNITRSKKMKTSIKPKKIKETNKKTSVRSFEVTHEFSKNINNGLGTHVFKNESKPMLQVLVTENANVKIPTETHSKCPLETFNNKYEQIPVGFNISTATIQATVQTHEAVENLKHSKDVTIGEHNGVNMEPVSPLNDQILVFTPLQNQFISSKEDVLQRVINAKDIIIESHPQQSFNESLSMVPIKVITPVEIYSLEKPQYIPDEMKNLNQTLKKNEFGSFNLQPQITQNVNCEINQYCEILPKPSLDIENTRASESNENKFFKKIITKEINIEGEIVEVIKHIPCLNETQIINQTTDINKQTIEPFINVGSSTKDEKTESNRHNSNAECLQIPLTQTNIVSNENNSLHSLDIQYQNTQQQQPQQAAAFEMGVINNAAEEKEVSPSVSLALPDTYNTIPVLPSISNTFPTPSNFSGIFSKKTSSTVTAEDEFIKTKKKSQLLSGKRKAYILPAASVLCNVDNLENATKPNKKLHWELLNNENEMTEIEDDADIDATDDEQIKIKNEPLKKSSLQKRLTHQSSSSETETHTEDESLSNEVGQRNVKCLKLKHTKSHKIKLHQHKLPKNVAVRRTAIETHKDNTLADNRLLIQKPFSIDMPKRPVGRPRKLDKKARNNNEELTLCHKKRGRKPKTIIENNNTQQEFPKSISESLAGGNVSENVNNLENSLKILSTSVKKLDICDETCSSKDSLKQTKSRETQIEENVKKDASLIYPKENILTTKDATVEERENSEVTSENDKVIKQNCVPPDSALGIKQDNDLNTKIYDDKALVSADQPEQLALTDKIIDNKVGSLKTDNHEHDTQDHEVSLGNSKVRENCLISRNNSDKLLEKQIHKSNSVKNKATTVISLHDIGIKVQPPKVHLSSLRIPKIKKNVEDPIDNSLNLEAYVELNQEADRQHLNKYAQSERRQKELLKEKKSSNVNKKNNEKVNNPENQVRLESPIEPKIDTDTDLNNREKKLDEVQQPKTQVLRKDDDDSSASNYVIKFDDKTKAGKRKLFSPDLYDASDTRENIEKERPGTPYDQSECLSKTHESNPVKLRQKSPEIKSVHCEVDSSDNFVGPLKTHKTLKKESNFEDSLKEQTRSSVSNNSEIKISCRHHKKTLYNEKEENKTDTSSKTIDDSKGPLDQQRNNLKLNVIANKDNDSLEPLKVIKSFKMRKISGLKIISRDLEKLSNNCCTRVGPQECGKNEENHVTDLPSNKDKNKIIESQSTSNQNLKESSDEIKSIVSVKLRRKSVYVERNSFCNDEHEKDTSEVKKLKILLEKKPEDAILDENNSQQMKPASEILIVSRQQTSTVTQRNSAGLLNSNIVDKESQNIQDPKNENSQQMDKVSDSTQNRRIMTRRKSTNQRRNFNINNKDDNSLNDLQDKKYSEESKQGAEKKMKNLRIEIEKIKTFGETVNKVEILDSKFMKLNSQNNEKNETDVRELYNRITEQIKKSPDDSKSQDAHLVSSDEIIKEEHSEMQTIQHQNIISRGKKDDKTTLDKHDTQNQGEVKDKLDQNSADTKSNLNNSHYIKVDSNSTSVFIQQTDLKTHRSTTNPSQFPKPSRADHKNSCNQKLEKNTNQQKLKEKIKIDSSMENKHNMEIDSDSSIILTQQKAIQVRRKSTNQRIIFDSSSEDDEPLVKKPTVIPRDVQTALTIEAKPKQRRRRVVKVLSTSMKTTANEKHTSPLRASHPLPLESPTLNHPIFNREVSIQSTEFVASLPRTPNQQDDSKFKEIDSKLHEIFQSPQYSAEYKNSKGLVASQATILSPPLNASQSHVTIDETLDFDRENNPSSLNISQANDPSESLGDSAPMLDNSEIKHLSLGSAEYRFEKVSENVINLFISRKRKRKHNT